MNLDMQTPATAHEEALESLRQNALRIIESAEETVRSTKKTLRDIELRLHDLRLARTPDSQLPFDPDDIDD